MRSLASTNNVFAVAGAGASAPGTVEGGKLHSILPHPPSSVRCPMSIAVFQVPTHYAAIFRGGDDAYLQVVQLTDFDYSQASLSGAFLDSLKSASSEYHEVYDVPGGLVMSSVVFGHELCT